jgi:DNA-binding NarL/FixJ family response regulator
VTEVVRVLIADDHARTRASVREALEDDGGFVVCAEAEDGPSAFDRAIETRPDVCLLDINMPGSGIAATTRIAAALPRTPILILTVSRDDNDLFDALRAGASGYLLKDLGDDQVAPAVRKVLAGEASLPGTLVARLVEEFRDREHRRIGIAPEHAARLTGREWDVLELMREGLSTSEIGARLFVSPTTVRTHVSSVLKKLQVADRDAAVRLLEASSPQPR